MRLTAAALACAVLLGVRAASAEPDAPRLTVDFPIDGSIAAVGIATWVSLEVLKPELAPSGCRWCDVPPGDAAVRDALRWPAAKGPDTMSNVFGFGVLPVFVLGLDLEAVLARPGSQRGVEWLADALVIAESAALAVDINQVTKLAVGRERPFVSALSPAEKAATHEPADNDLSFFSGHTTLAFSLAVSGGTIASLKRYRTAPLIWAGGLSLALFTSYLRIAADKHWFTDVVVGSVVGSGVGFLVPWLHRPGRACLSSVGCVRSFAAAPLPGGAAVVIGGTL